MSVSIRSAQASEKDAKAATHLESISKPLSQEKKKERNVSPTQNK